jgi:hypothetical protein
MLTAIPTDIHPVPLLQDLLQDLRQTLRYSIVVTIRELQSLLRGLPNGPDQSADVLQRIALHLAELGEALTWDGQMLAGRCTVIEADAVYDVADTESVADLKARIPGLKSGAELPAQATDGRRSWHHRKCWDCGHVDLYADCVAPACLCRQCGSQDTRRVREAAKC